MNNSLIVSRILEHTLPKNIYYSSISEYWNYASVNRVWCNEFLRILKRKCVHVVTSRAFDNYLHKVKHISILWVDGLNGEQIEKLEMVPLRVLDLCYPKSKPQKSICLPALRKLSIAIENKSQVEIVQYMLESCPNLEEIFISCMESSNFENGLDLSQLNLESVKKLSISGIRIEKFSPKLRVLKFLCIRDTFLLKEAWEELMIILASNSKLKKLEIQIENWSFRETLNLPILSSVTKLSISSSKHHLNGFFKSFPNLEVLSIYINDECAIYEFLRELYFEKLRRERNGYKSGLKKLHIDANYDVIDLERFREEFKIPFTSLCPVISGKNFVCELGYQEKSR